MTGPGAATDSRVRPAVRPHTPVTGGLPAQRTSGGSPIAPDDCGMHALLVDPDTASAQALADALTAAGVDNVTVHSGQDRGPGCATPPCAPPAIARNIAAVSLRPGGSAASEAISALRAAGWRRVVALAAAGDADSVVSALTSGATAAAVAARSAQPGGQIPSGIFDLSPREVEVLRMVADGRSNKWIGDRLELSALTVKSHLARIGRKLGTGERAHMVALALRAGVIG